MPLLFFGLYQMPNGHNRVIKKHSGGGEPHDSANFFPHFRLVAMHLAVRAEGFCLHERAFVAAQSGVGIQCGAVRAERCTAMLFAAVQGDHQRDDLFFPLPFCPGIHLYRSPYDERQENVKVNGWSNDRIK